MVEETKVDNVVEDVPAESTNNEEKSNALTDYKAIVEIIKEMDSSFKMLEEMVTSSLSSYGIKFEIVDNILQYTKENIPNMSNEEILAVLEPYYIDTPNTILDGKSHDELINIMLDIKDSSLTLMQSREEVNAIKKDSSDAMQEYFTYLSSDKIKEARKNRLERMKVLYDETDDKLEKWKIQKHIKTLEESFSFSYIKKRFVEYGDGEVMRLLDTCFKNKLASSYIMEKYKSKAKAFGFNPEGFKTFFNIEDDFLPEQYKPMNNLFLFIYLRFVAHSDPYDKNDKMLVYSLTSAVSDLKYHRFSATSEAEFLHVITEILDYFMPHIEFIKEHNLSWKEHPENIKRMKELRIAAIAKLGADIKKLDPDFIVPDDATVESLRDIYNAKKDEATKTQIEAFAKEKEEKEKSGNSSVEDVDNTESTECDHDCENCICGETENTDLNESAICNNDNVDALE